MILYVAMAASAVLGVIAFVAIAICQRPRVCITPEGFTFHTLIGAVAHHWENIDGPFGVIKIGWTKAVAYKLTADYKTRIGKKPTSLLSGYDEAIVGVFKISPDELAGLLNAHAFRRSP
jgi:hypothetical protein